LSDYQTIDDLLARLERERLDADRRYNDALTAVDRALQPAAPLPDAPALYDGSRVPDINAAWETLPGGPPTIDRSIKGRLRGFVWRLIGPPLETQRRFNAAIADHVNRNVAAHQEGSRAIQLILAALRREVDALVRFESLLVQYLQTITPYVESRDRSIGGSEIRDRLALTEQRLLALKRDVIAAASSAALGPAGAPAAQDVPGEPRVFSGSVDSLTYVAFEDRFRGSQADIRSRVDDYLPILTKASEVVDIGCGRGELLALLRERGVPARGVDLNPAMAELCRSKGFDVEQGDAVSYLERQAEGSVGGLVAIQVVEHFAPAYLARFLETAFHTMRPGAPLILETINAACWMAFFETYIRDVTHQQPLHPDTLRYLVEASGFTQVDVQFRQPVREADRLDRVTVAASDDASAGQLAAAINAHAEKLNARLFSSMDYVVIGRR
jgi:O-antigen chain-terminating methyltransferase